MAGLVTIHLSNGQQISAYTDANAVGSQMRVSMTGAATSSSPMKFRVSSNCVIDDIVVATCDQGYFEIFANGNPTGKMITPDQRYVYSVANRKLQVPHYSFKAGVDYTFIVRAALT